MHDIGKIDWMKAMVSKARDAQMFICNHHTSLALFRAFSKKEFLKHVETIYASYCLRSKGPYNPWCSMQGGVESMNQAYWMEEV